jgi:hypothetical protein
MSTTYKLPGRFFEDHMSRYWGEGVWAEHDRESERWTGNYVRIDLTDEQHDELLSDAEFYADGGGGFGSQYRGLMRSADATVRALKVQS